MEGIEYIKGKIPVLISAPHAYPHYRSSLSMSMKQPESLTDDMVKKIASKSNCHAIFTTKEIGYDPNFTFLEGNEYKQQVGNIIKENKIKLFIDFHGLSNKHIYDIGIYYTLRFSKSKKYAQYIRDAISKGKLSGLTALFLNFKLDTQETLSEFVAKKYKIPAIQLEIARYIREEEELKSALEKEIATLLLTI